MNFILRLAFGLGRLSSWCKAKIGIRSNMPACPADDTAIPLSLSGNDAPVELELAVPSSSERKI
jgi:hypothetical protein